MGIPRKERHVRRGVFDESYGVKVTVLPPKPFLFSGTSSGISEATALPV
jgi:hypothetical protein